VLEVDIAIRRGDTAITAAFTAEGGVTALFGRSGAGKTSVVEAIAGLLRPERGRIAVDGRVLFDRQARVDVPVHRRRLGCVFQEARLFPHMTVRGNLAYGRRRDAGGEGADAGDPDRVAGLLGLEGLLDRRPASLSGGERQRVAIGRALLTRPRLLLMDEPLASLDAARKAEIVPYLERLRDETAVPIVYVSHSVDEVTRLARTVVLMSEGRVAAVGAVAEIMGRLDLRPLTGRFEAGSVLDAVVVGHEPAWHLTRLAVAGQTVRVPRLAAHPGTTVRLRVRARDGALALTPPADASILNVLAATVRTVRAETGAHAEIGLDLGDGAGLSARITRLSAETLGLAPGKPVHALVKSVALDPAGPDAPR